MRNPMFKCPNCKVAEDDLIVAGEMSHDERVRVTCLSCGCTWWSKSYTAFERFLQIPEGERKYGHTKKEQAFLDKLKTASNDQLVDLFLEHSKPDDYNGAFTVEGLFFYDSCFEELIKRLKDCNFLNQN